jgi:hypothetical protein
VAILQAGQVAELPITTTVTLVVNLDFPFDVGPNGSGGVDLVYRRCLGRSCQVDQFDLATGLERRLHIGAPGCRVSALSIWKGAVAYALAGCRRAGIYVRGRSGVVRAWRRAKGVYVTGIDFDGTRILWSEALDAVYDSQVAIHLSTRAPRRTLKLYDTGNQDGYASNNATSVQINGGFVYWGATSEGESGGYDASFGRAPLHAPRRCHKLNRHAAMLGGALVAVDGPRVFYANNGQLFAATDPAPSFTGGRCW